MKQGPPSREGGGGMEHRAIAKADWSMSYRQGQHGARGFASGAAWSRGCQPDNFEPESPRRASPSDGGPSGIRPVTADRADAASFHFVSLVIRP